MSSGMPREARSASRLPASRWIRCSYVVTSGTTGKSYRLSGTITHAVSRRRAARLIARFMSPTVVPYRYAHYGARHLLLHLPDRRARLHAERAGHVRELFRAGGARGRVGLRYGLGRRKPSLNGDPEDEPGRRDPALRRRDRPQHRHPPARASRVRTDETEDRK